MALLCARALLVHHAVAPVVKARPFVKANPVAKAACAPVLHGVQGRRLPPGPKPLCLQGAWWGSREGLVMGFTVLAKLYLPLRAACPDRGQQRRLPSRQETIKDTPCGQQRQLISRQETVNKHILWPTEEADKQARNTQTHILWPTEDARR